MSLNPVLENSNDAPKSRITIGVLVDWIDVPYQTSIMSGISSYVQNHSINLIVFPAGRINSPDEWERCRNILYEFINRRYIDGLIVLSSTVGSVVGSKELGDIMKRKYEHFPKVIIGDQLENIPSIIVDNELGMREVMEHMVDFHGYKRIAFIKGPEGIPGADIRFEIFKSFMEERGIPLHPELIVPGNFVLHSGIDAVRTLLDERKVQFDAIISANDNMALGAINELQLKGRMGSESVPIAGFDDIISSKTAKLTTVKQPLYQEGKLACEYLIKKIYGQQIPMIEKLSTSLVIRESCGCFSAAVTSAITGTYNIAGNIFESSFSQQKDRILTKLLHTDIGIEKIKEKEFYDWLKKLLNAFIDELGGKKVNSFLLIWKNLIQWGINEEISLTVLDNILSLFRRMLISYIFERELLINAEDLFQEARIMVGEALQKTDIVHKLLEENQNVRLNELGMELSTALNTDKQMDLLYRDIPRLGIKSCYIALYEDPSQPLKKSRLILAFDEISRYHLPPDGVSFSTLDLIPEDYFPKNKRFSLVVQAMYEGFIQIGFIVMDYMPNNGKIYENLRTKISIASEGAMLVEKIKHQAQHLEEEVKDRTKDLSRTNSLLQIEITERKNAEDRLRKSEERFREMAVLLPTIIFETDINMHFTFLNKAGMEIFGIIEDDIKKGLSYLDYVLPEERDRLEDYCAKVIQGETLSFNEFRIVKKDGAKITFLSKATAIYNESVIEGIRWNAIDIKPLMSSAFLPEDSFFKEHNLSPREKEVLLYVLQGFKNKEIAQKLFITEGTIKDHTGAIYSKIGVKNREEFFEKMKEYQVNRFGYHSYIFSLFSKIIKD